MFGKGKRTKNNSQAGAVVKCTTCGYPMTLLLVSYVCDRCDPPNDDFLEDDVTPVLAFDFNSLADLDLDVYDDDDQPATLPWVFCGHCGVGGYSGSMCVGCGIFRP